jgi:hypothetical protein
MLGYGVKVNLTVSFVKTAIYNLRNDRYIIPDANRLHDISRKIQGTKDKEQETRNKRQETRGKKQTASPGLNLSCNFYYCYSVSIDLQYSL